jgi:hypothetical protein
MRGLPPFRHSLYDLVYVYKDNFIVPTELSYVRTLHNNVY